MDYKDLMIGDWVVYDGDVEYIDPVQIEGMYIATGSLITSDREDVGIDGISPIPITREILERNGFGYIEEDGYGFTHFYLGSANLCENMNIHIGTDVMDNYWVNIKHNSKYGLKYVHELQHTLKLFGIKLNFH